MECPIIPLSRPSLQILFQGLKNEEGTALLGLRTAEYCIIFALQWQSRRSIDWMSHLVCCRRQGRATGPAPTWASRAPCTASTPASAPAHTAACQCAGKLVCTAPAWSAAPSMSPPAAGPHQISPMLLGSIFLHWHPMILGFCPRTFPSPSRRWMTKLQMQLPGSLPAHRAACMV